MFTIPGSNGPGSALALPPAYLNEFYSVDLSLGCTAPPNVVFWTVVATNGGIHSCQGGGCEPPPGLNLFSLSGTIQGVALEAGSFEFTVEAESNNGDEAFQNVLLAVERDAGAGQ